MADHNQNKKKAAQNSDDVFKAPEIVREPMSRQVVLGGKISLRVVATGIPLPSYQWYLNGKKISGANSDRLVINKSRRDHVGAYTCEAKNFVGKVMSRAAMISFLIERIPDFVIEPSVASIPVGQPFKFRVASPAKDVLKRFKLQWIFNGKRITGATGAELQFTQVKKKYEGEYKVVVMVAGDIIASNSVKLLALKEEEPSLILPALTKEKTAFITAPPKESFFFDPLAEEQTSEFPFPSAESIETTEPNLMAVDQLEAQESDPPSEEIVPINLALLRKKKVLEKMLNRWSESKRIHRSKRAA